MDSIQEEIVSSSGSKERVENCESNGGVSGKEFVTPNHMGKIF